MSRKHFTIVLSFIALLGMGMAATVQAEIIFADNFDNAGTPATSDWALNANLSGRQSAGTLGTLNWGRDVRTATNNPQYIQVNHATWGPNKLAMDGNSSSPAYSGHSAIIQQDFNTGAYAAKIAAGHGFTVRFDIDPVSYAAATNQHGYGAGFFMGALNGSESNLSSLANTVIPGRNDPKVDIDFHFQDAGLVGLYDNGSLIGSFITFDTARAQEILDNSASYAKTYTIEVRVQTDNFNAGSNAVVSLWWGAQGTASNSLSQIVIGTGGVDGKSYAFQWDPDGTGFIGFHNYQSAATQSQFDNVSIITATVPEPSTLALLAAGLVGLLAYAWRKRK